MQARIGSHVYALHTSVGQSFKRYRENIIGNRHTFASPYGKKPLVYADWAASGRLYGPIEAKLGRDFGPFAANTHSHSNVSGETMTLSYEEAKKIIKRHVNAGEHDILLFAGTGMTGAVNKLQRLLGLKVPEGLKSFVKLPEEQIPIIFVTHMEHHSNHISWAETIGEVVCIPPGPGGTVDPDHLEILLRRFSHRQVKIGAFTACSNVTGFETPYYELARKMHQHGGMCFIDFSASAPHVSMDMHPGPPLDSLDGILFSSHKFLGGPGASGVLVMDARRCVSRIPDHPGGGTVTWTNPWGDYFYNEDTEAREDGGTPGVMQAIRTALCVRLKEEMGIPRIRERERELTALLIGALDKITGLHILGGSSRKRLGILSFTVESVHYNLMVKLLNDRFGIQVRGGCSCAGTYGHYLLGIDRPHSSQIAKTIAAGDQSMKPGWVRVSLYPTMTDREIAYIAASIHKIVDHIGEWKKDYVYDTGSGEWQHLQEQQQEKAAQNPQRMIIREWFSF
ncbi:selenocysteine lyase/cysteine desulfurase [Fontibacillus phaseoli]|uniref:Selenocysteine lyase/cysteine desulfurase n=1 Tax=Fontibacillus phaseoli TaxID=1416533 RepID=A0A369BB29_9BACL|nr:aminotransferase class V-fold PLP-dependent enzyme [Fontibacillus phaseoli]RCX17766.1 selenocysteine lyase/cysteine desulfurase [Fontibacillus phaseoli]